MSIINLSDTDTGAFSDDQFLQHDAKSKFTELLNETLSRLDDFNSARKNNVHSFDRVHNTIFINGKRGMGKTSFIFSIIDSDIKEEWQNKICDLGVIDPTMIETKEHIFLNVIQLIHEKIENEIKRDRSEIKDANYRIWFESLKKLASGLSILDGVGTEKIKDAMWDSPELILERGLVNVKQGKDLESNFHKLLDESLKLLDKKAFHLVFDDIDTSLDQGEAILEILRKYFTSRKLIITILGDIELYSTIVRQLQWRRIDPNGILEKYENHDDYRGQVELFEEQYLTKLLKPENRITLRSLYELKDKVKIQGAKGDEVRDLSLFIGDLVERGFKVKNQQQYKKLYEKTLLMQSTRSVVQALKAWHQAVKGDESPKLGFFAESLQQVFYTTIKKHLDQYNLHESHDIEHLLNLISTYLLSTGKTSEVHLKLLPSLSKEDENTALLYLNSLINSKLEPSGYLSYFIRVGYVISRYFENGNEDLSNYFEHVGLHENLTNSELARRMLTTFSIDSNTHSRNPFFFGNLSLSKEDIKKIKDCDTYTPYMSVVYNSRTGQHAFLSFFSMIGLLADAALAGNFDEFWERRSVVQAFPILKTRMASLQGSRGSNETQDTVDTDHYELDEDDMRDLFNWAKEAKKIKQQLSIADLATIWINVATSFDGIDERRQQNSKKDYNNLLELYSVAFLNAVFILCEQKKGNHVDIKSPSTDENFFYKKMDKYNEDENEVTFFDFLRKCPLFDLDDRSKYQTISLFHPTDSADFKGGVKGSKRSGSKISFRDLSTEEKIKAISSLKGWANYKSGTIKIKLREKGYSSVPELDALLTKMKSQQ